MYGLPVYDLPTHDLPAYDPQAYDHLNCCLCGKWGLSNDKGGDIIKFYNPYSDAETAPNNTVMSSSNADCQEKVNGYLQETSSGRYIVWAKKKFFSDAKEKE